MPDFDDEDLEEREDDDLEHDDDREVARHITDDAEARESDGPDVHDMNCPPGCACRFTIELGGES